MQFIKFRDTKLFAERRFVGRINVDYISLLSALFAAYSKQILIKSPDSRYLIKIFAPSFDTFLCNISKLIAHQWS